MQESIAFLVRVQCRRKESSRSLSHLLISFLFVHVVVWWFGNTLAMASLATALLFSRQAAMRRTVFGLLSNFVDCI